ncbi:hypothetical protein [Hoylesella loescheii]|uniref:hypothetical protein n=1 Tax=Hoylesella loescheii TaxID=840 RepID=UPI000F119F30|nr:hypothetical protein [Hoylesella loescheii]RKW60331.1 MAG: hypothetical protein D8H98_07250 [Prevotella sp.]
MFVSCLGSTGTSAALLYAANRGKNILNEARQRVLRASPVPNDTSYTYCRQLCRTLLEGFMP